MERSIEIPVNLKIDFREQQSGMIPELDKFPDQINYNVCTLPTGDYCILDKIIVERKTLPDFLVSIKTGRIFQQAFRIAQSDKNGLIILEGEKASLGHSEMSRKAVQGALLHLTVFIGIPIIRSLNVKETASLLRDLINQCQKEELPRKKQIILGSPGIHINNKQKQKLFLIQNLHGIGVKKGLALLRSYNTIEKIVNASVSDLIKIQGIGNKLANRIYAILHEPF